MNKQTNSSPGSAMPTAPQLPVLPYAPVVRRRVSIVLHGTIVLVTITNLALGLLMLLIGVRYHALIGPIYAAFPAWCGPLLLVCGILLCIRTEWGWRRSFDLLLASSVIFSTTTIVSSVAIWRHPFPDILDRWMPPLIVGGLIGVLNSAAGYVLSRIKPLYGAEHCASRGREMLCLVLWPLALLLFALAVAVSINSAV